MFSNLRKSARKHQENIFLDMLSNNFNLREGEGGGMSEYTNGSACSERPHHFDIFLLKSMGHLYRVYMLSKGPKKHILIYNRKSMSHNYNVFCYLSFSSP